MTATTIRFTIALTIGATAALGQNPDRPGPPAGGPPPAPLMQALDLNRDGRIDAGELAKAADSLKSLDRDGDGQVSPEEMRPQPGRRGPGEGPQRGAAPAPAPFTSEPLAKSDREKEVLAILKDIFATQRQGSMSVPEDDGRILRLLVESLGAKQVVEIGTSVGYSGVWIGLGLQTTGGKLTTFEIDEGRAARARENFKLAGLEDSITIVMGDAHETVKQLKDPIDLLFLDADKDGYVDYLNKLLPLVRPGGLIVAHNINQRQADPRFVKAITTNPNLETLFLNLQTSGLSVTMKKR
ncbi:MAG: class I SAM-dependent methyltransferase [Akkermansiaceae bacterium]|jgi:predicted O-methyltransferase YrrM|nr:class I SAM-dependent methyltransferase [Akkermansiaceae bacterium]